MTWKDVVFSKDEKEVFEQYKYKIIPCVALAYFTAIGIIIPWAILDPGRILFALIVSVPIGVHGVVKTIAGIRDMRKKKEAKGE